MVWSFQILIILKKIKQDSNLTLLTQPGLNIGYLAFNLGEDTPGYDPHFKDVRVRKAVYHAINRKDIVEHLYKGTAVVAKNPLPPSLWGYNDEILIMIIIQKKQKNYSKKQVIQMGLKPIFGLCLLQDHICLTHKRLLKQFNQI